MNIRKDRIHKYGYSNIDFRSKKDEENIKIFQPWLARKPFGTMGYTDYKLPPNEQKRIMEVSENINQQKNINAEIPDPKYYKTAQYYRTNKIPIKAKTIYTNERIAQLEESLKGKDVFTGESMMIAEITKYRKRKTKEFVDKDLQRKCIY